MVRTPKISSLFIESLQVEDQRLFSINP